MDTSALMAIYLGEEDAEHYERALFGSRDAVIGAPTAFEFAIVARARRSYAPGSEGDPVQLLSRPGLRILPWDADHLSIAREAFRRYGKGQGHPAQLNFGDCMSYAAARALDVPLLFKGGDFALTDVQPAI